jgi:hypothetical protein
LWHPVGGFESGVAVPDPVDNNIVWSGNYDGMLDRFDLRTMQSRGVTVWPESLQGWAAAEAKYRFQWTFPIAVSPHDHNRVYVGSQFVHMTTDGGQSWTIISPDLTTNDKTKQQRTGGITQDDASPLYACCLFALAESPLEPGVIWAGSNDGLVHMTRDGGKNWVNVTANIPGLSPGGTISNVEPSRFDPGTCYITVDLHQENNRDPYVYKTADYGKSWTLISAAVPKSVFSYAHCVREDPARKGMLYLGTENAVYASLDDGKKWIPLQSGLPHAPAHWLAVQEQFGDLAVATYGRGFWILDDLSSLRQLTPEVLNSDAYLFTPRPAYRFRSVEGPAGVPNDPSAGDNPPYGASLNYFLKSEPKEEVSLRILDENGRTVRTLKTETKEDLEPDFYSDEEAKPFKMPKEAGINRVWWDLRYDKTRMIKLRTEVLGHDHVKPGPEGWRRLPGGSRSSGPLVPPGTYKVILSAGAKEFTQTLLVRKDPHSAGSEDDIQKQTETLLGIYEDIDSVAEMINRIEWVRKQIGDLKAVLREGREAEPILKAGEELDKKLREVEGFFFPLDRTGSGDDLRFPDKFYAKLHFLAYDISKSDFPPTDQQLEVKEMFERQLGEFRSRLQEIIEKDIASFNAGLREKNIPNIIPQ